MSESLYPTSLELLRVHLAASVFSDEVQDLLQRYKDDVHYLEQHQFSAITSVAQPIHLRTHVRFASHDQPDVALAHSFDSTPTNE